MIESTPPSAWYLLQCKPRQDLRALEHLQRQHYRCFLPTCQRERVVRGTRKLSEESLFPGYLFIYLEEGANWAPLRSTRGVARLVSFGGLPLPVEGPLIAQLQERSIRKTAQPLLQPGDTIRISEGPFAELDAIFLCMEGEQRVVLLMKLLQREQQVRLPLGMIRRD